jgi:hypothetical protein
MSMSKALFEAKNDDVAFRAIVERRRAARMEVIDRLPEDVRQCVHDYGWTVVKTLMDLGLKKPKHIRHVVETILNEFSPTRGTYASQGTKSVVDN